MLGPLRGVLMAISGDPLWGSCALYGRLRARCLGIVACLAPEFACGGFGPALGLGSWLVAFGFLSQASALIGQMLRSTAGRRAQLWIWARGSLHNLHTWGLNSGSSNCGAADTNFHRPKRTPRRATPQGFQDEAMKDCYRRQHPLRVWRSSLAEIAADAPAVSMLALMQVAMKKASLSAFFRQLL